MLEEFARYSALQRDQAPLAALLVYLKRKGGYVQLNQIWRDLGPTGGGPFWNQTTLINKLDKLERIEVLTMERRILPSPRSEAKKKTNTFYRLNPATPLYPHIYSMLKIYKEEPSRYSSELVEKPLDRLSDLAKRATGSDPAVSRELEVAMELIGEVFSVGGDEVKRMIKERMAGKGMVKEKKIVQKKEKGTDRKKDGSKKRTKKDAPPAGLSEEAAE
jgi:hypothetical protein